MKKIKLYVLIFLSSALVHALNGQVAFQDEQVYPLAPSDSSLADLEKLKPLLTDKKYILLGEQAHSEGSVFSEKIRMIRFLHEQMGFNIIAFESGLFDCYKAYLDATKENSIGPMQESVYGIWSDARELTALFDYILETNQTSQPLRLAGFDDLGTLRYLDVFWEELQYYGKLTEEETNAIEPVLYGTAEHVATEQQTQSYRAMLEEITRRLPEETESQRILKMAFQLWRQGVGWQLDELQGSSISVQNPRDKWMADGFRFLAREYEDEKIIAWGASYHFANQLQYYENTDLTRKYAERMRKMDHDAEHFDLDSAIHGAVPMGRILKEQFGDSLYSLAFTAFEGEYQLVGEGEPMQFLSPPDGSFEKNLHLRADNALVDLSQTSAGWFYTSALGHLPIYARWPKIFDGIYLMREVRAPVHIEYDESTEFVVRSGENKLYGRVIDAETLQPVPYATISFTGTQKGVASNAIGEFELNPKMAQNGLVVSSIGYESDTILLSGAGTNEFQVRLTPKSFLLSEVTIRDKPLSVRDILRKAKKAVQDNYASGAFNQEMYYSMIGRENDSLFYNEQGSVLMYFPEGYQPKTKRFGKILQYRLKEKSQHRHSGMGQLWLVFSHDVILDNDNVLTRTNAYDFRLDKVLAYQDRLVYDIAFNATRPTAFTTGYGYPAPEAATGHIYIATDDFAVLKYDICVERQTYSPKKEPDLVQYPRHHHLSQSFMRSQGKYFLQYSFIEHEVTTTRTGSGDSVRSVQQQYLTSMELFNQEVMKIDRPVMKLNVNARVKEEEAFYDSHGYIVDQERVYEFYCGAE